MPYKTPVATRNSRSLAIEKGTDASKFQDLFPNGDQSPVAKDQVAESLRPAQGQPHTNPAPYTNLRKK